MLNILIQLHELSFWTGEELGKILFLQSFIYLFIRCSLSPCYVPNTILIIRIIAMNKTITLLQMFFILVREDRQQKKQIKIYYAEIEFEEK